MAPGKANQFEARELNLVLKLRLSSAYRNQNRIRRLIWGKTLENPVCQFARASAGALARERPVTLAVRLLGQLLANRSQGRRARVGCPAGFKVQ